MPKMHAVLCRGTLIDGTVFDSSYARGSPTSFAPNQVIKGWTEAMQLMVEGDKWEMYIPSDLAYGDRGSPPKIGGGETLIFLMEIIKVSSTGPMTINVEILSAIVVNGLQYIHDVLLHLAFTDQRRKGRCPEV